MKEFDLEIAKYLDISDNNTLQDLKKYIRKYVSIEFTISGKITQCFDKIRAKITGEYINVIYDNKT